MDKSFLEKSELSKEKMDRLIKAVKSAVAYDRINSLWFMVVVLSKSIGDLLPNSDDLALLKENGTAPDYQNKLAAFLSRKHLLMGSPEAEELSFYEALEKFCHAMENQ